MDERTKLYGAYGSNMTLEQMSRRCPKAIFVAKGILEGYKLTFRGKLKGVANIEPCKGSEVPIVLWEITEECEEHLDLYGSYPNHYSKKEVKVNVNGNYETVMVYIMTGKYRNMTAVPTEHYFNVILRGYSDNEIDLKPLQLAYSECSTEIKK
jgi:gamma-glutamylcyclotransferase (GGCT)/AIG2-like uncharacterized protein YtfP